VREEPTQRLEDASSLCGLALVPDQAEMWDNRFLLSVHAAPVSEQHHMFDVLPAGPGRSFDFTSRCTAWEYRGDVADSPRGLRVFRFSQRELQALFSRQPDLLYVFHRIPAEARFGIPIVCKVRRRGCAWRCRCRCQRRQSCLSLGVTPRCRCCRCRCCCCAVMQLSRELEEQLQRPNVPQTAVARCVEVRSSCVVAVPHVGYCTLPGVRFRVKWRPLRPLHCAEPLGVYSSVV
jgi:hypothetical protein